MDLEKKVPKRIITITQFEDDTLAFNFFGISSRSEVRKLTTLCDREAIRRRALGKPFERTQEGEK